MSSNDNSPQMRAYAAAVRRKLSEAPAKPLEHAEPAAPLNEHVRAWQRHIAKLGGQAGGHRWTRQEARKAARVRWAAKGKGDAAK